MPLAKVNNQLTSITTEIVRLENVLRNSVLPDLKNMAGQLVPILVNCRLNETVEKKKAAPIWCGWVEEPPSSGPSPIPGDHLSPVYQQAYHNPNRVKRRDYSNPEQVEDEKLPDPRPNQHNLDPLSRDSNGGFKWRRYVCIKAKNPNNPFKRAGTLTVGFSTAPQNQQAVEDALTAWAKGTDGKTALVELLADNFDLGGRDHP